jgi:hypothetical protein
MKQPLIVAYGLGVDSTAAIVELYKRGIRPDAITFANVGNEKKETYAYLPIFREWLRQVDFPDVTVVQYRPKNFKNWPPYHSLGENCLTNGTLPSLAFGFKSCSLKWKVAPQNQWTDRWGPAMDWWATGGKVRKIIGYDASGKDLKRYAHAKGVEDPKYDYWYPLIDWGMDRDDCKEAIRSVGLPVPPKSACIFCPATQPEELHTHRREYLRYIVVMEARAKPRLEKIEGLWRNGIKGVKTGKPRPGTMTAYIVQEGLLPAEEVRMLQETVPAEIIANQALFAQGGTIPDWHDFLELFSAEDAIDEGLSVDTCSGCVTFTHSKLLI